MLDMGSVAADSYRRDDQNVTVATIVSWYPPVGIDCEAGTRPCTGSDWAIPVPVPESVSVPTVLPQFRVRPAVWKRE